MKQGDLRLGTTYQQATIPIGDPTGYSAVHEAVMTAFAPANVTGFLRSLDRNGVRVREFESVLERGLLGEQTQREYSRLGDGDQGQIREFYLASLEQVAPELRGRFFKLYAYY